MLSARHAVRFRQCLSVLARSLEPSHGRIAGELTALDAPAVSERASERVYVSG